MNFFSKTVLFAIGINAVVFPNAQKELLTAMLVIGFFTAFIYRRHLPTDALVLVLLPLAVTLFYCVVGLYEGASAVAIQQAIIIYVISPVLWIMVIDLSYKILRPAGVVASFAILSILAGASVALYYFLFLNYGPGAVAFFGSNANVHLEEGYAGVIMHVSGSLIFLGAAFFAEPGVIRARLMRVIVLSVILLATIASGRTAAIVGVGIGVFFFFVLGWRNIIGRLTVGAPFLAVLSFVLYFGIDALLEVDVLSVLGRHFSKIAGGDVARPAQIWALLEGAEAYWFVGAGHGIGVEYIRSAEFPWRYEAVYFALLLKLGTAGVLIVLLPLILALFQFLRRCIQGRVRKYDGFFGAALVAVLVASMTNPYLEGVVFHWMFLFPTYHFLSMQSPSVRERLMFLQGKRCLGHLAVQPVRR